MSENISKTKIKNIGNNIKNNSLSQDDLSIFSEWRSSHAILTRELAKTLKKKVSKILLYLEDSSDNHQYLQNLQDILVCNYKGCKI